MEWINNNTLAAAVKKFRLAAGYSQRSVADSLGYSRSAYAYKESGRIGFSVLDLQKLATLFRIPVDVFFHRELYPQNLQQLRFRKADTAGLDRMGHLTPEEQELVALLRLQQVVGGDTLLQQFREALRKELSSNLR